MAPMGSGLAAFATEHAADAFAATNEGTIHDWPAMLTGWEMSEKMQHRPKTGLAALALRPDQRHNGIDGSMKE
jgi:hypothetical protein